MKSLTYQILLTRIEKEGTITLRDVSTVVAKLVRQSDDVLDDYQDYEYENDSRNKMRNIARMIANGSLKIFADSDDYHNLAVDFARQDMYDCAIQILTRGLEEYPLSTDLLADTILYGKDSGQFGVCEKALNSLLLTDRDSWGWRAYSFVIDYYLDVINQYPKGSERTKMKNKIHDLADKFIIYSQRNLSAIDRAYSKKADVIRVIGGDGSQEEYLLAGYEKSASAPMCSLRLADIMFERGDYEKVLVFLQRCKYAVNAPQPDVNPAYVYLLYAMSSTSKLMLEDQDGDFSQKTKEIEAIYKDFHTAMKSYGINRIYENAAKRTIKMIEIQTGVKDKTPDIEEDDY